jgi:phytoene dehydrogenase-like protein
MPSFNNLDAIAVGSGPIGLAAAITLVRTGLSVAVYKTGVPVGGGMGSAELTQSGFIHDICSAVNPLATVFPSFRDLSFSNYGLKWIEPPSAWIHPLESESRIVFERSVKKLRKD